MELRYVRLPGACLLLPEFTPEGLLPLGYVLLVTVGIDEGRRVACLETRVLAFQVEVTSVSAEEVVARQRFEDCERFFKILRDSRIRLVVDKVVSGVHIRTADDHDVTRRQTVFHFHRPRRASFRVTRRQTSC